MADVALTADEIRVRLDAHWAEFHDIFIDLIKEHGLLDRPVQIRSDRADPSILEAMGNQELYDYVVEVLFEAFPSLLETMLFVVFQLSEGDPRREG